jgi:hypothetical protein
MKNYSSKISFLMSFLMLVGLVALPFFVVAAETASDQVNLSVTVDTTISLGCGADVGFGTLVAGTPVLGSSTCTVTTNAESGYDLQVKRDDADTTMDKDGEDTTNIDDKTAWDPTSNSGDGNAATWSGTGLGFGVYSSTATKDETWWGSGSTYDDASNKYAGFSSTYTTIMDHDSYSATSTTTGISYKLDVPATQKAGAYSGSITYQVTTKP